jgi:serine/threonine protein kinase
MKTIVPKETLKISKEIELYVLEEVYPPNPATGRALYKVQDREVFLSYALKVFDISLNNEREIINEMVALNGKINQPDMFPKCRGYFKKDDKLFFIMDWMEGITLKKFASSHPLVNSKGEFLPEEFSKRLKILKSLLNALAAIHKNKIIHRDLKPENIIVNNSSDYSGSLNVMIIDFGLSVQKRVLDEGTPGFQAPEQLYKRDFNLSFKTDIFSLGQIILWFLTGTTRLLNPNDAFDNWCELNNSHDLPNINKMSINDDLKKRFENILNKCLSFNPKGRPELFDLSGIFRYICR